MVLEVLFNPPSDATFQNKISAQLPKLQNITVRVYVYRCIRSSRDRYWSIFMPRFGFFWKVYASEPLVCNSFSLKYYI